jgi:DMSO/TMAO reductase YedYZ molybdopterin-dependent catalytic subunit
MASKERELPPGQTPTKNILRWGIDHSGITRSNPKIDLKTYTLTIDGTIENPQKLSWSDVLKLPAVESVSDFHCVEGWSVLGCKWQGIRFKEIINLVKPRKSAGSATFECVDGYTTSLTLEELSGDNVLLAYKLDTSLLKKAWVFRCD